MKTGMDSVVRGGGVRWGWVCLVAFLAFGAILCVDVPLLDPDEGLHAAIAQEMIERGDWVTPRVLGEPFFDKPILYFWALCGSLSVFGMNAFAVRLPGLLFGMLTVGACWYAARVWFGKQTGRLALCIQATTLLPFAAAQAAVHDVPLVLWTIGAVVALWSLPRYSTRREDLWRPMAFASLFLGLAILTKGLIGVAFVMLAYVPAAVLTRRLPLGRLAWMLGVIGAGGLVIASPWYAWMEVRNPGYLSYYFYERHIVGFLAPTKWHGTREWWYYLPILIGGGLPWGPYLPGAARQFATDWRQRTGVAGQAERVLLWCWLVMGVLFLSAAKAKLLSYCLPLFPPCTILAADFWNRGLRGELSRGAARYQKVVASVLSFTAPLLMPALWGAGLALGVVKFSATGVVVVLLVSAVAARGIWGVRRREWDRVFASGVVSIAAVAVGTIVSLLPSVAEEHSGRGLAVYLNQKFEGKGELILFRERIGSVLFYLRPELRRELSAEQMQTRTIREFITTFEPREGQLVVIPEREVPLILHYVEFSHLPYEEHGRYRVYTGRGFDPLHVRRIPPGPEGGGVMAN